MRPAGSALFRLSSACVLLLSLLVCSCVKLSHQGPLTEIATTPLLTSTRTDSGRLNLNTASAHDLEALPGVGKILAERILAHRAQYGPFRRVEHLMMVRGFSDHKFRALRERVTVE
ncbi:MAG: helix-hairpin-helix domain-containing protein [Acidobacteriota bacterium]|nr:helix-hairpin-helix domain-containing protein [Acidobacteriota bacterium]